MQQKDFGECPICCDPFEFIEQTEVYFCPCKFLICGICKGQLECCPSCRRKYDDYQETIENPFFRYSYQKIKSLRVLNKQVVRINFRPEGDISAFGDVIAEKSVGNSTLIIFAKEDDARDFAMSMNGVSVNGRLLKANIASSPFCGKFTSGKLCDDKECMFAHSWTPGQKLLDKEQNQEMFELGKVPLNKFYKTFNGVPPSVNKALPLAERIGKFSPEVQDQIRQWSCE